MHIALSCQKAVHSTSDAHSNPAQLVAYERGDGLPCHLNVSVWTCVLGSIIVCCTMGCHATSPKIVFLS